LAISHPGPERSKQSGEQLEALDCQVEAAKPNELAAVAARVRLVACGIRAGHRKWDAALADSIADRLEALAHIALRLERIDDLLGEWATQLLSVEQAQD
jgi:hypothetical protein